MDMETFMDWRRHYQHAPWGEIRGDLRMSILAALTANVHRDSKKRSRPYEPTEFLAMTPSGQAGSSGRGSGGRPGMPADYEPTTPEQFHAMSSGLRAAFGAQPEPTPQLETAGAEEAAA
jgi:hypothetical protein